MFSICLLLSLSIAVPALAMQISVKTLTGIPLLRSVIK